MNCELGEQTGGGLLWQDPLCRVVLIDEPGYPGFCRVIWKKHIKEMTDLAEHERGRLLAIVLGVESVLRDLLQPDKINLASLGNLTPHLHWHVIPRFSDDPHFPYPVWAAARRAPRRGNPPGWHAVLAAALAARLDGPSQAGTLSQQKT